MSFMDVYNFWLEDDYFDQDTKNELLAIKDDAREIEERFYKELEFGTGGLRGVIGAGTNRMNLYTVRKATQGLANFILKQGTADKGVAIAYDSRRMSPEFADEAALCLAANGIKAYVFDALRPTPELSFAVRKLGCTAGIVVTASHNPPEYNGYKVYWEDGAQVTAPKDKQIIEEVLAITDYHTVKTMDKNEAMSQGLYVVIGKEIDDAYMVELKKQIIHPEVIQEMADDIKIVYTPLCGTGNVPARRILSELGFKHVYVVPEQENPDPNFTTLEYPNPEDPKAFTYALRLAKEKDADIVLATDPDADRLGVYVRDSKTGEYHTLTGNMSGCLLAEYEINSVKEQTGLPSDGALIKSIVSSNMADAIADYYGVKLIEVLTGFKYIGQQILKFETTGKGTYLFGFEESYGCLIGTHARDKDAIVATMALCEAAAYYKTQGKTLWDAMIDMYEKYGYYKDEVTSMTFKGIEGLEQIKKIMSNMRSTTFETIAGYKVLKARDYQKKIIKDMATGTEETIDFDSSNVLYYELEDNAWFCVRPSGTEPKIKFYFGIKGNSLADADNKAQKFADEIKLIVEDLLK